tara:strand:+ start:1775 stop:2590 length:816 start_codon:yes stop_codon:yes gene_type:complete
MHTPGHNPYIEFTPIVDPYLGAGYQDFISAQSPSNQISTHNALNNMLAAINAYQSSNPFGTYQYEGINDSIQGALANIFSGFRGHSLNEQLNAIQDLYAEDYYGTGLNSGIVLQGGLEALVGQDVIQGFDFEEVDPGETAYYGTGLSGVNIFDPESLAATLSQIGGVKDPIQAGEVKALTPEMIEKTTAAYYDPVEDVGRQKLIGQKTQAMGKAGTGGFAGSGARTAGLSGAEQMYRGGYGNLLEDIMSMQAGATENVLDTIYGWQELMGQ